MGVPLEDLSIDTITWTDEAIDHMKDRRREQGSRLVTPEEATEAALDPRRRVRVAAGGRSLKVIGHSPSTDRLIKVWIWTEDVSKGDWYGGSAVDANSSDRHRYCEEEEEGGGAA